MTDFEKFDDDSGNGWEKRDSDEFSKGGGLGPSDEDPQDKGYDAVLAEDSEPGAHEDDVDDIEDIGIDESPHARDSLGIFAGDPPMEAGALQWARAAFSERIARSHEANPDFVDRVGIGSEARTRVEMQFDDPKGVIVVNLYGWGCIWTSQRCTDSARTDRYYYDSASGIHRYNVPEELTKSIGSVPFSLPLLKRWELSQQRVTQEAPNRLLAMEMNLEDPRIGLREMGFLLDGLDRASLLKVPYTTLDRIFLRRFKSEHKVDSLGTRMGADEFQRYVANYLEGKGVDADDPANTIEGGIGIEDNALDTAGKYLKIQVGKRQDVFGIGSPFVRIEASWDVYPGTSMFKKFSPFIPDPGKAGYLRADTSMDYTVLNVPRRGPWDNTVQEPELQVVKYATVHTPTGELVVRDSPRRVVGDMLEARRVRNFIHNPSFEESRKR